MSVPALIELADADLARDDFAGAWEMLGRAFAVLDGSVVEDRRLRAEALQRVGRISDLTRQYDRALWAYRRQAEILRELPDEPMIELLQARYNIAEIARHTGDNRTAISEFEHLRPRLADAARLDEVDDEPRKLLVLLDKNLGQAYLDEKRGADAEAAMERALASSSQFIQRLRLRFGIAAARQLQCKAIELAPLEATLVQAVQAGWIRGTSRIALTRQLAELMADSRLDRAIALLEDLIAEEPTADSAAEQQLTACLVDLAFGYLRQGEADRAIDLLLRAVPMLESSYARDVRAGDILRKLARPRYPITELLAYALARSSDPQRPDTVGVLYRSAAGYKRTQADLLRAQYELALTRPELRGVIDELRAQRRSDSSALDDDFMSTVAAAALPDAAVTTMFERSAADQVSEALDKQSALVEYARLQHLGNDAQSTTRYVAFVLLAGDPEPRLVQLGSARSVESAAAALVRAIESPRDRQRGSWRRIAGELAALIWEPLREHVGDRKHIVIAPDGQLCQVPFDVLPDVSGEPLLLTRHLSLIGTGRDLVRLQERTNLRSEPALVVAGPDYGQPDEPFAPLGAAVEEGREVAALLGVDPVTGARARREAVLAAVDAEIIHLATHGYAGGIGEPQSPDRRLGPLAECGVALANANVAVREGVATDGLLTGLDVLGMELGGTDMVVLSACSTNRGVIDDFEGVLGLARSFLIGGARSVVASLWRVDDEKTCELMTDFYRRLLGERSRVVALADAKRRAHLDDPERPDVWAGFVSTGDVGALLRYRYVAVDPAQVPERSVSGGTRVVSLVDGGHTETQVDSIPIGGREVRVLTLNLRGLVLARIEDELARARGLDDEEAIRIALAVRDDLSGKRYGRQALACALSMLALRYARRKEYHDSRRYGLAAVDAYADLYAWPQRHAVALDNLGLTECNLGFSAADLALVEQGVRRLQAALEIKLTTWPRDDSQIRFTESQIAAVEGEIRHGWA